MARAHGSDRPLARRLFSAPDSVYLARHLRIAFTDGELEILEHDHVFQSAFASANDTPDDARLLVKLGGAVLAARKQQRLRLQKSSDEERGARQKPCGPQWGAGVATKPLSIIQSKNRSAQADTGRRPPGRRPNP